VRQNTQGAFDKKLVERASSGIELTIDTRITVYSVDLLGIGDLIDIENTRDVVSLQRILLTGPYPDPVGGSALRLATSN
jgi:hypothetical protein